jgi:hypothetical protein
VPVLQSLSVLGENFGTAIFLKQRWKLIPGCLENIPAYLKPEKNALEKKEGLKGYAK